MKRIGVSLIVLIITIVVVVILATVIIVSISRNNIVTNSNIAVNESDLKTAQEAVSMWISDRWMQNTNLNGIEGEEVGAYYSGTITKEPSEIIITKDEVKTKISVTLKDLGLNSLDKVEIENNVVKSFTKNGVKYDADSKNIEHIKTISFDANEGIGTLDSIKIETNQEVILPSNTFTKTGYIFNGWNTKFDGTGRAYSDKEVILVTESIKLYAQWKKSDYIITFNSNSGSGEMQSVGVCKDETFSVPINKFTRSGYEFSHWNTKSDNTGKHYFQEREMKITSNIELYAQWVPSTNAYFTGINVAAAVPKNGILDNVYNGNYDRGYGLFHDVMLSEPGKTIVNIINNSRDQRQYIYSGTNIYTLTSSANTKSWMGVEIRAGGLTTGCYFGGFKLIFSNNATYTLNEAINNGYIEPLVICSSSSNYTSYLWYGMSNILSGGNTNTGNYPAAYIIFKVKNIPLTKIQFYTNTDFNKTYDGLKVIQMPLDWKLSKTKW